MILALTPVIDNCYIFIVYESVLDYAISNTLDLHFRGLKYRLPYILARRNLLISLQSSRQPYRPFQSISGSS